MFIDRLNLNQIRVFECVYRTGSMTTAAQELHLTQSGVSQHIKTLESTLEVKLFDRLNQKLVPTSEGQLLFEKSAHGLKQIESALWEIRGQESELRGTVKIGMPIEFGNNILVPLLAEFGKQHPFLKYEIKLDFANVLNDQLLTGELDFAFVDEYKMSSPISTEHVFQETFELCVHQRLLSELEITEFNKEAFEKIPYVAYQRGEPVLHRWFSNQFPGKHLDRNVRVTVMDVQANSRFICEGFGAGILPGYILKKLQTTHPDVVVVEAQNQVINSINLATLTRRTQSMASQGVIEHLKNSLREKSN